MSILNVKEGDLIGPWKLKAKIGEGAYGSVYRGNAHSFLNHI